MTIALVTMVLILGARLLYVSGERENLDTKVRHLQEENKRLKQEQPSGIPLADEQFEELQKHYNAAAEFDRVAGVYLNGKLYSYHEMRELTKALNLDWNAVMGASHSQREKVIAEYKEAVLQRNKEINNEQ